MSKTVTSEAHPLEVIFSSKYSVDFYQREYVWKKKHIEDLVGDLSKEFLKNWKKGDPLTQCAYYDPYFMGELVFCKRNNQPTAIIDGQQRITSLTLLLIYLLNNYSSLPDFPKSDLERLVYSNQYGVMKFNLDIPEREACLTSLFKGGTYTALKTDPPSVQNIIDRYQDISDCWNPEINNDNVSHFAYWLKEKVVFSRVETDDDEFAYVIFETMNDRGLSLTQIEMLRSYLLASIDQADRNAAIALFDGAVAKLTALNTGYLRLEFDFFKVCLRSHFADTLSQSKGSNSDFTLIGKKFHRWVVDNSDKLGLKKSADFIEFIRKIDYFADVYVRIHQMVTAPKRDSQHFLYMMVNYDYGFTLQPALLLAPVKYGDSVSVILEKFSITSKYLTKNLSWRVWNQRVISQSSSESAIYELCKNIRDMDVVSLKAFLDTDPLKTPALSGAPTENQQNRYKLKVLIALITAIVAEGSGAPDYLLDQPNMEVEHIWADVYAKHTAEFSHIDDFHTARSNIGDLLVLPKSFNASYGKQDYSVKVNHYYGQNILAKSLNSLEYIHDPGFARYVSSSKLPFKAYSDFLKASINERADLYKAILLYNWK